MPGRGTRRIQLWLLLLSSSTFLYRSLEKGNETHKQIDRDFHPHIAFEHVSLYIQKTPSPNEQKPNQEDFNSI